MEYIHYGSKNFDPQRFQKISNIPEFIKPSGGLWASRVDAEYGWKEWCNDNSFNSDVKEYFKFNLKPDAKILIIENATQLNLLPKNEENVIINKLYKTLDFEKLAKEYDAIEVLISADHKLYWDLYGWDCDSILIMNPEKVDEIKEQV